MKAPLIWEFMRRVVWPDDGGMPEETSPDLRDIVRTTMWNRSGRAVYLPGALDRVVANAPPFIGIDQMVNYLVSAIEAEEIPRRQSVEAGWFDWFEHAHEMV